MTAERAYVVGVDATDEVLDLIGDLQSAAARARKAEPGDRSDVIRFENLFTRLEQIAARSPDRLELPVASVERASVVGRDPASWTGELASDARAAAERAAAAGRVPVFVVDPLGPGPAAPSEAADVPPPAQRWAADDGVSGRQAVEARFRAQLDEAIASAERGEPARPIAPSGVQNGVVTEILREYAEAVPGTAPVPVPVEYRDGSRAAHPLALRSLKLVAELGAAPADGLDLHFALLSIRHTEMDAVVHGAWLRNAEISRPRPAAQTDDLVYEQSRTQLLELTSRGLRPVRIHMYQTGLETAVVGFYRAVVDHLLEHEGTVAVQPMYFANAPQRPHGGNAPRGRGRQPNRGGQRTEPKALLATHAPFRKGTPWQT